MEGITASKAAAYPISLFQKPKPILGFDTGRKIAEGWLASMG
ncbi:hypothetical protein [Salinibacter sp.]